MTYDQLKAIGIKSEFHSAFNLARLDRNILVTMNDGRKFYGWELDDNFHEV